MASTIRQALVVLLAAWLPLACCCAAAMAEAPVPAADEAAGEHACCAGEAGEGTAPSDEDREHDGCACEGDARVATVVEAPVIPSAAPLVGVLDFWGAAADAFGLPAGHLHRSSPSLGDSPPPAAPSLRALGVLLTV